MQNVLTLNPISDRIFDHLDKADYTVSDNCANPVGILVRSAEMKDYPLPESVLAVARAGAGTNNIPSAEYAGKGVAVFNTPGANANGVCELVLGGMIAASRNIVQAAEWVQTLKGQEGVAKLVEKGKKQFVGNEIKGKKLGVIGLGAIGGLVANDAYHLGMEVLGYDTHLSVDAAWRLSRNIRKAASMDQLFAECDYITIHVPLLDSTKNMINKDTIATMKDGVVILNFARGGLVNSNDIKEALASGKVAKYVLDFPDEDMLGVPNVLAIPHLGASTPESEDNCAEMAAKQLNDYIRYGNIVNSVNLPSAELPYTGRTRICIIHKNVANMIGRITEVIAGDNINISDMINKSRDEIAYTIIDIDSVATEKLVADIKAVPDIIRVRVI